MEEMRSFHGKLAGGLSHSLSGSGYKGERYMVINKKEILVNRWDPETSTIYQFYGCKWHGFLALQGLM